jgi:predicted DNA-binding transcriptional regulator AlpA
MERVIRPAEAAQLLGIGISTLYEWLSDPAACAKPLPRPRQVGPRAVGWPSSEFEAFIRDLPPSVALPRAARRKAKAIA